MDGLDGSGKATQTSRLMQALQARGKSARAISFPDYGDPSSALVKLYLNGELAENADEINAYAASSFYAVDRYASFKRFWERDYRDGKLMVADRYTSSNAIHQMAKLPREEWDSFLAWLDDYEHEKLGLPRPDLVLYLDMHPDTSAKLLAKRYGGDENKKDIHEKNVSYLLRCRETALYAAEKLHWQVIGCCDGRDPLPVEAIHGKIMDLLRKELKFLW
ncbi:thymidylate kinase [Oscillospiraceae bacterium NSJ-54]|uniref:Thymidylate kinase n=2 Tax=Zongyangia hominis TaxID=2763677 RepID=A0A926ECU9_9FIRM|nr:thymidylate kinase [Zongyangia hominis]